ncbi:MAG: PAS domain S-box protein [Spirochaetales bacterium]|nr:PAS domain S-box protein [Spirochaetales bacterium]
MENIDVFSKLTLNSETLELIIQSLQNAVAVHDADFRLLFANPVFYETLGVHRDEIDTLNLTERIHPDDISVIKANLPELPKAGKIVYTCRWRHKTGSWLPYNLETISLHDDSGKTAGYMSMIKKTSVMNKNLNALLSSVDHSIFELDAEGRFISVWTNKEEELFFPKNSFLGKKMSDVFPENYRNLFKDAFGEVQATGKTAQVEYPSIDPADSRWWLARFNRVMVDGQYTDKIVCTISDITDRKVLERELKVEFARAQMYMDLAPFMFMALDEDGSISLINQYACSLLEWQEDDLIGKNWFDTCLLEEERETVKTVFKKIMSGDMKEVDAFENSVITASGKKRIISWKNTYLKDDHGHIIGTFSSGEDITEKKLSEKALREKTEEIDRFFSLSIDLLCIADTEGYFHRLNPEWEKTLGYTLAELEGKKFLDFVHPDDIPATLDAIKLLESQKEVIDFTNRYQCRDGSYRWLEWRSIPKGKMVYAAARDITDWIKAKNELLERENSYKTLANNLPGIVYRIYLRERNRMVFFNDMLEKLTGYEEEELKHGMVNSIDPFIHPEDRPQFVWSVRHSIENKLSFKIDYRLITKTGDEILMDEYGRIIEGPDGKPLYIDGVIFDVTEKKTAEREIGKSVSRFLSLFENMAEGVALHELVYDDSNKPVNYKIIEVNPQYEKILDLKAKDVKLKNATEIYNTEKPPYLEEYATVVRSKKPYYFETYFPPMEKYFEISVAPWGEKGFATIFSDITARKKADNAVAGEKERLLVTLRSIGDGVITTDINGIITLMNKAAEAITGYTTDEAAGKPLERIFHIINQVTRERCANPVEKVLKTGRIISLASQTILICKDGVERVIADSGAPIRDPQSKIIGVVLVFRDITEKEKIELALQNTQRLESLSILAGGIAHDFNNLLNGIFGYMDCANEFIQNEQIEETKSALSKVFTVYSRAKSLTRQLLTFAKGGVPVRKTISLKPIIKETTLFALSGTKIKVKFTIADNLWHSYADANQIGQVIDNLVINACQAMESGGSIRISASNVLERADLPPVLRTEDRSFIRISVQDSGHGISRENMTHIFDPFFSTKEEGSGLGLSTTYSIINRHDGYIEADSLPGKGTTFTFFLPAAQTGSEPLSVKGPVRHRGKGRILFMDDEAFIRDLAQTMMTRMGYDVVCCKDGKEAIDIMVKSSEGQEEFQMLILDLTIPGGMGGLEAIREIRKINPDIKAVASSGYSSDPVMAHPKSYGFTASIIKPYRIQDIAELLEQLL